MTEATAVPENEQKATGEKVLAVTTKKALKRSAMNAKRIAPRKTTLPVFGSVAVDTRGGTLTLRVTDQDVFLSLDVEAEVGEPGFASANAYDFKKALTHLPDAPIRLIAEGESLVVEAGTVRMTFYGLPEDEFPQFPDVEPGAGGTLALPVETWRDWSDKIAPFASTEDSRPILNGVLVRRSNQTLDVVATNGHHLMHFEQNDPEGSKAWNAILPGKPFVKPLKHILRYTEASGATLTVGENHARLDWEGGTFYTRLIEGPFFNWEVTVPSGPFVGTMVLPREDTLKAMKVLKAAFGNANRTTWELTDGEVLTPSAFTYDGPTMEATIPGSRYDGEDMLIAFNGEYVKNLADAFEAETLFVHVTKPERGVLIDTGGDSAYRALLMPLRLLD